MLQIGDKLNNGATILALGPIDRAAGKVDACAVLGLTVGFHPFVVWTLLLNIDNSGTEAIEGDYFRTLNPALAAFNERKV